MQHKFKKLVLVGTFAAGFFAVNLNLAQSAAPPTYVELAKDWCLRDAPGFFRRMRAEGFTECPTPSPVGDRIPRELVIPLPCDRSIVFRRIDAPASSLLDQVATSFGGIPGTDNMRLRYAQATRFGTISGGFTIDRNGALVREAYDGIVFRSYYLAAYELTLLQWSLFETGALAAFSKPVLPSPEAEKTICLQTRTLAKRTPPQKMASKIGLGFYDAIDFTRALNAYIMAENGRRINENRRRDREGKQTLSLAAPWERGSPGFVRLPSEAEWEFAARGGAISAEATIGQTYLVEDREGARMGSLDEVANLVRLGSKIDEPLSGTRKPNLAGLYDMVGNAEEITLDLFRLVRPDGAHGTRGGFVLRGGNLITPRDVAGVSRRTELPLYKAMGEARTTYGGLRPALVAPVFPDGWSEERRYEPGYLNREFEDALRITHEKLTSAKATPGAEFRDQAHGLIQELKRGGGGSDEIVQRLLAVEESLRASEVAINAAEIRKIEATVTSAVTSIQNIRLNGRLVYTMLDEERNARARLACIPVEAVIAKRRAGLNALAAQIQKVERQIEYQTRYVLTQIGDLGRGERSDVDGAVSRVRESFKHDKLDVFDKAWSYFVLALEEDRDNPSVNLVPRFRPVFDDASTSREELKNRQPPKIDCTKRPGSK